MTLTQRLASLEARYKKAKRAHRATYHLQREMVMLIIRQLKREIREERRHARN
jgi:hypothetical protein